MGFNSGFKGLNVHEITLCLNVDDELYALSSLPMGNKLSLLLFTVRYIPWGKKALR